MNSEYCNQNAYDCIQIHGGSGFMMEYACQRIFRDARITSIYEGTTQLQTVAAIRYVTNGFYSAHIAELEQQPVAPELQALKDRICAMAVKYNAAVEKVVELKDQELQDFVTRRLYEMAADIIMSHLILADATEAPELFAKSAQVYVRFAAAEIEKHADFVANITTEDLVNYRK